MLEVIKKHKIILALLAIIMLITLIWLGITLNSTGKVPSRGVFVENSNAIPYILVYG
ncbi:MAG: hypothetical protein N2645_20425 [Clostridia bacterium]|nr:hypothetical protein [Clostridia bacterium]